MIVEGLSEISIYTFILEMILEKEGWDTSQIENLRKKFCPNTHGFIEICYDTITIYDEIKKYIDGKIEEDES